MNGIICWSKRLVEAIDSEAVIAHPIAEEVVDPRQFRLIDSFPVHLMSDGFFEEAHVICHPISLTLPGKK